MRIRSFIVFLFLVACNSGNQSADSDKQITAQQDSLFRRDAKAVLAEVDGMVEADQAIRFAHDYGNLPKSTIDSLANLDFGGDMKAHAAVEAVYRPSDAFQDSVSKAMIAQDARHTARIVALTTRYGYPSSHRLDGTTNIDPFLIFHHPSDRYKDTVMKLLTRELRLGRMDSHAFNMIRWSYNGRVGLPEGMRVVKIDTLPDGRKAMTIGGE